jgi:hypothetical protein
MATWDGSWKTYSLKTDYNGNDVASMFPTIGPDALRSKFPYKSAQDFVSSYPANRPTSKTVYVRFITDKKSKDYKEVAQISESPRTGDNWYSVTIGPGSQASDVSRGNGYVTGDSGGEKNQVRSWIQGLADNNQQNQQDFGRRDTAAADYNRQQDTNLNNAVNAYNNNINQIRNEEANKLNTKNQTLNDWSNKSVAYFSNSPTGSYVNTRDKFDVGSLQNLVRQGVMSEGEFNNYVDLAKTSFKAYYLKDRIRPWDAESLGVQPPTGGFNSSYYSKANPAALSEWNDAVINDNLDLTGRYSQESYLYQHYTNVGRFAGYRGNEAIEAERSTQYTEALTDYEKQLYRDQVLGITSKDGVDTISLATPEYDEEGNITNQAELNTVLESNIASVLNKDSGRQEKQLQLLAQDVLQQSINELKKAKEKESNLMLMKNLPTYSEIMNINTTLTNSILGDASFGGMLGFVDPKKTFQTQLEKDIAGLTGVSSNATVYNWQKWFDDTLLKRYETFQLDLEDRTPDEISQYQEQARQDIKDYNEIVKTDPTAEKPLLLQKAEQYKLDIDNADQFKELLLKVDQDSQKDFLSSFINGYIKPRFDQSKSMDEFISYLDVKEEEQNIFQSQSVVNKLKQVAELRSNAMLSFYKTAEAAKKGFDADFYLDPVSKATKDLTTTQKLAYENQKAIVDADFEAARNGRSSNGIDWATEAYRYGYEGTYKTDPKVFAKLHYQTLGSTGQLKDSSGNMIVLDPAEDILGYNELQKKITAATEELVIRKDLYGDTAFMKFVTPEEFADSILSSVSPEKNKEEWDKILKQIGLEGEDATVENVRKYLIESFRTEEAKNIRESIKYLNEQKETLNQEKLGVSYIEREADKKDISAEPETQLYQIFKSAGFAGSEDDFYTNFMPDVDREEQKVLSKSMSGEGLTTEALDLSDPFTAFSSISNFFDQPEETTTTTKKTTDATKSSYFNIFGGDEEEPPAKSKAAQSILGEFTSMFKGFS